MKKLRSTFLPYFLLAISLSNGHTIPEEDVNFLEAMMVPDYLRNLLEKLPSTDFDAWREDVSDTCQEHTRQWLSEVIGLLNGTKPHLWALHMLDAWAKPPEGLLSGHFNPTGDYDECTALQPTQDEPIPFTGKYCTTYLLPIETTTTTNKTKFLSNLPTSRESVSPTQLVELMLMPSGILMAPSIGTCFPSSCSNQDIGSLLKSFMELLGLNETLQPLVSYCAIGDKPSFDSWDITIM